MCMHAGHMHVGVIMDACTCACVGEDVYVWVCAVHECPASSLSIRLSLQLDLILKAGIVLVQINLSKRQCARLSSFATPSDHLLPSRLFIHLCAHASKPVSVPSCADCLS
jgi:hypothetical protein